MKPRTRVRERQQGVGGISVALYTREAVYGYISRACI